VNGAQPCASITALAARRASAGRSVLSGLLLWAHQWMLLLQDGGAPRAISTIALPSASRKVAVAFSVICRPLSSSSVMVMTETEVSGSAQ